MTTIKKKSWPRHFEAIQSGQRKFDFRLGDDDFNVGDFIILEEWDPDTKQYTGRTLKKKITHAAKYNIDKLFWPAEEIKKKGIQILSLE